ncbi:hypothetical protein FPOAC2_09911 [Fusarium poae]
MPYISFSSYHKEDESDPGQQDSQEVNNSPRGPEQHDDANPGATDQSKTPETRRLQRQFLLNCYEKESQPIHSSPTLDEYYYHFNMAGKSKSKEQRISRNETQVVTKELFKRGVKDEEVWTLLRVNQLWAWTIGEDWLITASSCASSDSETRFVKDILEHLGKKEKEGNNRHGPRSPADLRDLIAEYCISIYERKYNLKDLKPMVKSGTKSDQSSGIKQNRNSTSTPGKNDVTGRTQVKSDADKQQQQQQQHNAEEEEEERERSIRQIFSDAINEIGRVESELFRAFCDRQSSEEGQKSGHWAIAWQRFVDWLPFITKRHTRDKNEKRMTARQQLDLLNRGTTDAAEYLFKIKDIRDELNILKTIAKSQHKVQSGLTRGKTGQTCHNCHIGSNSGPDINAQYVLSDILELDQAASQAQEALQTTLSLQDSQIANLQAEESAQQGRILFVFTLFTVVFVPLSFFTSLFALNVDDFLSAPPWALIVIFTAPLPLLGLAALYVYYSGKNDSSKSDKKSTNRPKPDPEAKESPGKKTHNLIDRNYMQSMRRIVGRKDSRETKDSDPERGPLADNE